MRFHDIPDTKPTNPDSRMRTERHTSGIAAFVIEVMEAEEI